MGIVLIELIVTVALVSGFAGVMVLAQRRRIRRKYPLPPRTDTP